MSALGRVAFLGTGAFGVPLLERIAPRADELLVVSQPDRPAGRGLRSRPSPVAEWARDAGFAVVTPRRLRSDEGHAALREFAPDGILLAAYGQLVPADLLTVGVRPPLNVHPSLLPRHRGAAPVASTILAGDRGRRSDADGDDRCARCGTDRGPVAGSARRPRDHPGARGAARPTRRRAGPAASRRVGRREHAEHGPGRVGRDHDPPLSAC